MAQVTNTFIAGKMNKSLDDRLIPKNQYKDGLNIRVDSSDASEAGRVENEKGNERLAQLVFRTTDQGDISLSGAKTIGAYADGQNETIYYFVHDPSILIGSTQYKYDAIISYNVEQNSLRYIIEQVHPVLVSGSTVLNFDPEHLITGVDLIDNLLFFTDDLNPPRYINVDRTYSGIQRANPYSSLVTEDDISVIVKPPSEPPSVRGTGQANSTTYMEDKFICFAYRWKYIDGQYSALSQFTEPSFTPLAFSYDVGLATNKNMKNVITGAEITVDTGSELVTDIEVVFKEMTSSDVYVIERVNKSQLSGSPSTTTVVFENQKIFTQLDPNQIVRLYDNVPLKAKAQTTMGNRVIYGNYVEGYDLTDSNGDDILTNFTTELQSSYAVSQTITTSTLNVGVPSSGYTTYDYHYFRPDLRQTYDYFTTGISNPGTKLDFTPISFPLRKGTTLTLTFDLEINISQILNTQPNGTNVASYTNVPFVINYVLEEQADNITELFNQSGFQDKLGLNAETIQNKDWNITTKSAKTSGERFPPGGWGAGDTASDRLLDLAQQYAEQAYDDGAFTPRAAFVSAAGVDSYIYNGINSSTGTVLTDASATFQTDGVEVGDWIQNFGRSVSGTDEGAWMARVESVDSETQLTLDIDIFDAVNQEYAVYDFDNYQTNKAVLDAPSQTITIQFLNAVIRPFGTSYQDWVVRFNFLTNLASVNVGSDPTLKTDRDYEVGIIYMDDYNRSSNVIVSSADATTFVPLSAAPNRNYMRVTIPTDMTPPSWATRYKLAIKENKDKYNVFYSRRVVQGTGANAGYLYFFLEGENAQKVSEGDIVYVKGDQDTEGSTYLKDKELITKTILEKKIYAEGDLGQYFYPVIDNQDGVYIRIDDDNIGISNTAPERDFVFTFETQAEELDSFIYYESFQSFPITNSFHEGNIQNQSAVQVGIVDTEFANAYTFYNGVESRNILDSIAKKNRALGNRIYSTTEEEYRQIRRKADLTYSGIYQPETNVNKLNEFNLGLANFKELEESFGPIQKLFARETDVLVLQEDKISYVLAGKNLLSDSIGGGSITSVPEVLGTQIARKEEYGISFNPESFASYGYDRYFTDVKRGAVLQLRGGSAQSDQLTVISEFGMRSYFRDTLEPKLYKQVIGAYDEYSNEYVLSASDEDIPQEAFVIRCGSEVIVEGNTTFVVELGEDEGDVTVIAERISGEGTVDLDATWNSVTTNIGTGESGDFNGFFTKSPVGPPTTAEFTYTGVAKYRILVNCPIG